MTKKQLEARVQELERKIAELTGQMLTLSLRQPQTVFVPNIQPPLVPAPVYPTWPPHYPYVGDVPNQSIITCGTSTLQSNQNIQ